MDKSESLANKFPPLSATQQLLFLAISFVLVAFGQPAWISGFGLLASIGGYALFWRVLITYRLACQRFSLACVWFCGVQLVQLSWFISHPYLYIFAVYFLISLVLGIQFGIIGMLIHSRMVSNIWRLLAVASFWVILEWTRLFFLSGFAFDPVGIALAGNLYAMQPASIFGVFGLSFLVIFTNLLGLRAWSKKWQLSSVVFWVAVAALPYAFGVVHVLIHDRKIAQWEKENRPFRAVLVQTAFPIEEKIDFNTKKNLINYVIGEWRQILNIIKNHHGQAIDLIVLPEFVVPFGTYSAIYPLEIVNDTINEILGTDNIKMIPEPKWPLGSLQKSDGKEKMMVNNAFWAQAIANIYGSGVLVGLEDAEDMPSGEREYYSAAILFKPQINDEKKENNGNLYERYEKRILVPMGEYIPFSFCKEIAKQYGVFGSFTPGKEAKVMTCGQVSFSPSICYEETFGDLMREGRQKGAGMLVNLTSDVWYPNSKLPLQHLEHSRLRTVENGVPLLRACNTGITAALDSLGRTRAVLGGSHPEHVEWVADSLYVEVPTYTYATLYSRFGDWLIIGFSFLMILISNKLNKEY